jgi:hypothetical protein
MKKNLFIFLTCPVLIFLFLPTFIFAQYPPREDAIWARTTTETITLDGVLDEPAWAAAESLQIAFGNMTDLPTSGWRAEFQAESVTDPTNATVKFLVSGNQLYMAFIIPDSSIGGSPDWARWDGILMSIKDRSSDTRPTPALEYFYTYWYINLSDSLIADRDEPRFVGAFGNFNDTTRTPEQIAAWDAKTVVIGNVNDDSNTDRDESWTVEMRIDLGVIGYNALNPEGEIVELNFSIWDCDFQNGGASETISTTRTHWQSPWGNANAHNVGRVHIRPDITINTVELPEVEPDVVLTPGTGFDLPTIDGMLDEDIWNNVYSFDIAWDDEDVRNSYPGVGPYRSGQFQPELGGNPRPPVLDPARATIKMFFRDHFLYLAADVSDQIVQGSAVYDLIDGVRFMISDRASQSEENVFLTRRFLVNFDQNGDPQPYEYLAVLADTNAAEWAVALKGATTVNENSDIDEGYMIEMKIDLTFLGYPADLGDKLLFMGVMLADGDSFDDPLSNYGTRTWWFREHDGGPAYAWMVMDDSPAVSVNDVSTFIPNSIELYGNYPNPFNPSTKIRFSVPSGGNAVINVYNALGENVAELFAKNLSSGLNQVEFNGSQLSSGVYFFKVNFQGNDGKVVESKTGKMVLMK